MAFKDTTDVFERQKAMLPKNREVQLEMISLTLPVIFERILYNKIRFFGHCLTLGKLPVLVTSFLVKEWER
jgi:hypothetical protein